LLNVEVNLIFPKKTFLGCQIFNNPNTQCNWHAKKKHSLARQESALTPSRLWSKRRATARQKNPRPLSTRGQQARVKTQKSENGGRKTLKLGFIKVNLKVLQAGVLCSVIAYSGSTWTLIPATLGQHSG
jgi:hypothetical protein